MSESNSSPDTEHEDRPEGSPQGGPQVPKDSADAGTFLGGTFGGPNEPETTAEQIEGEDTGVLASPPTVPAEVDESLDSAAHRAETGDVEGLGDQVSPGDRNEPI